MSIRRRLEALEEVAVPQGIQEWPDWELQDQLEEVMQCLRVHRLGGTRQLATDRQIHLMGLLCALWELPGGAGEYRFPSGVAVTWYPPDDDGLQAVDTSGRVGLEDLPDDVRKYWERMDPAEQPARDRRLYEMWRELRWRGRGEGTS